MSTTQQPDDFSREPFPVPAVELRAARSRSSKRVGRARALLIGGAVVTSLVGAGAIAAVPAIGASSHGSGTSTTTTSGSSGSTSSQSSLATTGSSSSSHGTTSGS